MVGSNKEVQLARGKESEATIVCSIHAGSYDQR